VIPISSFDMPKMKKGLLLILCSLVFAALVITIMSFGGRIEVYMGVDIGRLLLQVVGAYFVAYSFQKRFRTVLWVGIWVLMDGIETVFMGMTSFLMSNHPIGDLSFYAIVANTGGEEIIVGGAVISGVFLLNWAFSRH